MINELEYRSVGNVEAIVKIKKKDTKHRKEYKRYIRHY